MKLFWYLAFKYVNGWDGVFKLVRIILQDTNATLVAALLHTITLPITVIYFVMNGANYEGIDFASVHSETDEKGNPARRLTIKEGTIFHYWTYKKPLTWFWLILTAGVDLILSPFVILTIITVPIQFVLQIQELVVSKPLRALLWYMSDAETYLPEDAIIPAEY